MEVCPPGDDSTQNTNSSSALSVDNATDELGRRILEHAQRDRRDRQRMRDATAGGAVQAFKRARPRAGLSLTMENLERKTIALAQNGHAAKPLDSSWEDDFVASRKPHASESEHSNSPNVNVPQQWGRKGRQKNDFLRRLSATSPPNAPNPVKAEDPDAIWQRRTVLTGDSPRSDIDWVASPSDHGDLADQDSPLRKALSYGPNGSVHKTKANLERKVQRTPEMATGPLWAERHDLSGRTAGNRLSENDNVKSRSGRVSMSPEQRGGRIPRPRQPVSQTIRNADGAPIGTTRDMLSGTEHPIINGGKPGTSVIAIKSAKSPTRESELRLAQRHRDTSSRDLLKQLAASSTPSPTNKESPKQSRLPTRRSPTLSPNTLGQDEIVVPRSRVLASMESSQDSRIRSLDSEAQSQQGAPLMEDVFKVTDSPQPKTPVVTGAWIDTPAPRHIIGKNHAPDANIPPSPVQSPLKKDDKPNIVDSDPPLSLPPSSAAAALLQDPHTHGLNQSTVATLRSLTAQDEGPTGALMPDLDDSIFATISRPPAGQKSHLDHANNTTRPVPTGATHSLRRDRDRDRENELLSRMDERLRAARHGLRDASRGLKRVEKEVEEVSTALDEKGKFDGDGDIAALSGLQPQSHRHMLDKRGLCEGCEGVTLAGLARGAAQHVLGGFYTWDRKRRRWLPRLTWLGLISVLVAVWCVGEVALCDVYCHQLSGEFMHGWGVDINAPRMPYVATTVLVQRPLQRVWSAVRPLWREGEREVWSVVNEEGDVRDQGYGDVGWGEGVGYLGKVRGGAGSYAAVGGDGVGDKRWDEVRDEVEAEAEEEAYGSAEAGFEVDEVL